MKTCPDRSQLPSWVTLTCSGGEGSDCRLSIRKVICGHGYIFLFHPNSLIDCSVWNAKKLKLALGAVLKAVPQV